MQGKRGWGLNKQNIPIQSYLFQKLVTFLMAEPGKNEQLFPEMGWCIRASLSHILSCLLLEETDT